MKLFQDYLNKFVSLFRYINKRCDKSVSNSKRALRIDIKILSDKKTLSYSFIFVFLFFFQLQIEVCFIIRDK